MNKKAIYPGSFDPFAIGHLDIVKKSAAIFDQVYVVIGVNAQKKRTFSAESMICAIEKALADANITNVVVTAHAGLVAQYAKEQGIGYMIRGLRNNMDYNYEENIAEVNKLINPTMESVYFRADNVAVSSSMVKELHSFGLDVSPYLPKAVYDILQKK
jgi:pantetheine-phosphate adenylyltransferase